MPTIDSPPSSAFATSTPVPQRIGAMVLLGLSGCFFSIERSKPGQRDAR